jgi:hypothetical protein
MNKWGVRLAGWYFIIWALLTAIGFMLSPTHAGGFFGVYMYNSGSYTLPIIGSGAIPQLDLMALGKSIFLVLAGYFILRLQSPARVAALTVLWPSVIIHGFIFVLVLAGAIYDLFAGRNSGGDYYATFYFFQTNWPGKITDPILLNLIFTGRFLLSLIPTYILMRKDVKRLFQRTVTAGGTTNIIHGEKS